MDAHEAATARPLVGWPETQDVDDAAAVIEAQRRQLVGEPEPDADPTGEVATVTTTAPAEPGEAAKGSASPTDDDAPVPHTFTDRASFLVEREAFVASYVERLRDDPEGELARKMLAEVYATSIETRLSLFELDDARRQMMQGGGVLGRALGLGKGKHDAKG